MSKFKNFISKYNSLELATFAYVLFTTIYILIFYGKITNPLELLINRLAFSGGIVFISWIYRKKYTSRTVEFCRFLLPLALIIYWYPETYFLTHGVFDQAVFVPNMDGFFDRLDILIFHCSPAMEFSAAFPWRWLSEIMYFSYFFYYIIYIYIAFYFFFRKRELTYKMGFIMLFSFFIFYILFVFIPVEGPQFYYPVESTYVPDGYIFSDLMRFIQSMGEKPTGAFPSSHVGMTFIYMIILFKYRRKVFWIFLPVTIFLCMSTVYIKAHYLIDVVAAFILTPFIYWFSVLVYRYYKKKFPAMDNFITGN